MRFSRSRRGVSFNSIAFLAFGAALSATASAAFAQTPAAPVALSVASAVPLAAQATEPVNLDMMAKIRDEGMNRSEVMQTIGYLTDVIGPRLTASPSMKRANEWTKFKMMEWGLQNAKLEAWGPFGRGWVVKKFSAQTVAPVNIELIAYPKAWSPSIKKKGDLDVVYLDASDEAGLVKYKGTLKNKIVLVSATREIPAHFEAEGKRLTDAELAEMANAPLPTPGGGPGRPGGPGATGARRPGNAPGALTAAFLLPATKLKFAQDEGAALVIDSGRGDGGTVFVQQASVPYAADVPRDKRVSAYDKNAPKNTVPQATMAGEHYNRLIRMLQAGESVKMNVEMQTEFTDLDNGMAFNTTAEIPGTDKKDELVMCGAHMDSWHTGTGATDNAAGVGVCLEAVRILQKLGVKPRRTIRVALWSGEEEGLFGSTNYVAQHFGTADAPKPEYDKLSAYYNLDNGTGKVRGVFAQSNPAVVPIFQSWLAPFSDLGATTVTLRNTGSTDHIPFDRIGLPGFQYIQDGIEYFARTHHSNMDVFDRIQADDMKEASVLMAAFLYNTAMRDEKMPRKPVAPAQPAQ